MTESEIARLEMLSYKRQGNLFGYKQAKRHYERLLRRERLSKRSG